LNDRRIEVSWWCWRVAFRRQGEDPAQAGRLIRIPPQDMREETVQCREPTVASRHLVMTITFEVLKERGDEIGIEID